MKKIILVIFTLVSLSAFAQTNGDIVDRLNATLGVRLPAEYEVKVKEFAANDTIMRTRSATAFTEQFIIEQFKNDWGIDRQNQLLFMWSKIYGGISQKKLYNWLDDDNKERSSEYKKCLKNISEFYEGYKKGFKEYMEQKSAEAKRQSAEAKRQSAEAKQEPIAYIYHTLYYMIYSYSLHDFATDEEIKEMKEIGKNMIQLCNQYNIDYKSLFPLEVQKFYGIEPTVNQSNTLSCDKAKINILNIGLQEIVKLYNLYQKTPQVERKIETKHYIDYIETCKENDIDYKAILRKELGDDKKVQELLKFYGVE